MWTTVARLFRTREKCKIQFSLPELWDTCVVEWTVHITEQKNNYDMADYWSRHHFGAWYQFKFQGYDGPVGYRCHSDEGNGFGDQKFVCSQRQ